MSDTTGDLADGLEPVTWFDEVRPEDLDAPEGVGDHPSEDTEDDG